MVILVVAILVFGAVTATVLAFVSESRQVRLSERIERVQQHGTGRTAASSPLAQELQKSFAERVMAPQLARLRSLILTLTPEGMVEATRIKLENAGSTSSSAVGTFIALRVVSAAGGLVVAFWLLFALDAASPMMKLAAAGITAVVGILGPSAMLDGKAKARQAAIKKALPDCIDLLVVSTEAGTGLDGALQAVVQRKKGPLVDEFQRVLTEVQLGRSRTEAWRDMAERVGLSDLKMLVASLRQAEQLGVSIANTLRTQADALRTRRSLMIRQVAATLGVKMLFPLIFCILPALFVVIMGPGLMTISSSFSKMGW